MLAGGNAESEIDAHGNARRSGLEMPVHQAHRVGSAYAHAQHGEQTQTDQLGKEDWQTH